MHHTPAPPANGEAAIPLGRGKREMANTEVPHITPCDPAPGINRIHAPGVVEQGVVGRNRSCERAALH